jgi:hypothetical protein
LTSSSKIIKNIEKLEIYYKMFKKYIWNLNYNQNPLSIIYV